MKLRYLFCIFCLFLILPVSIALPFTLPAVYTNWWNTSWTNRSTNMIPDGARPYQLSVIISNASGTNNATHLFCNGRCSPNFSDIRFTLDNGTELPYWIENTTTGTVWVNLTANGSVNMYYGNRTVASKSNGNATFILWDGFDTGTTYDTAKWNKIGTGATIVSGGKLLVAPRTYLYSKSTYAPTSAGKGYFMRAKVNRNSTDIVGWGAVGFSTHSTAGDDTHISYPLDAYSGNSNFSCIVGKDAQVSQQHDWGASLDNAPHIVEIRRRGTQETCLFDSSSSSMTYPSTIARYLAIDAYSITMDVDYIFLGNNQNPGASSWETWGASESGSAGTAYTPPVPVLSMEMNGTIYGTTTNYRYYSWSNGSGNRTDAYVVGLNDTWTVNTHIQSLFVNLTPHQWMNVSVYALNYSNSTLNMTPLVSNYQNPNRAPVMSSIGNKTVYQNHTLSIQINATDNDDVLTYGTNATKGALSSTTGLYTLNAVPADVGTYTWRFNASDAYGGVANETITVTVRAPRTITLPLSTVGWQITLVNDTQTMSSLNTTFSPTYISIWNSDTQEYNKYKSGWSHGENISVSRDQAAMIKVSANVSKSIYLTNAFNWTLNTGLNLIGVPQNMTLSQINSSLNTGVNCTNVDEITYPYPNNMSEATYTCQNGAGQANASVMVGEGRGVWMNAVRAVDIKNVAG